MCVCVHARAREKKNYKKKNLSKERGDFLTVGVGEARLRFTWKRERERENAVGKQSSHTDTYRLELAVESHISETCQTELRTQRV